MKHSSNDKEKEIVWLKGEVKTPPFSSEAPIEAGYFMDDRKRKRLEAAGWQVGTAADFLELSSAESEMIELKLALSRKFKDFRERQNLSQKALAEKMQSSQSRVAKIEAGDSSITIDLMVRGLLTMGATRPEIAEAMLSADNKERKSREFLPT